MIFNTGQFNNNFKSQLQHFYNRNKLIVWLMLISLTGLILTSTPFMDVVWITYLIYFAGVISKYYFDDKKIVTTYLSGAIAGGIVYALVFMKEPDPAVFLQVAIGSAAFALLTGLITFAPDFQLQLVFFGKIKLLWLGLILIALDLLTVNPMHPNSRIAHIGGIIIGFLLVYFNKKSKFNFKSIFNFRKKGPHYNPKHSQYSRPVSDEEYNRRKKVNQDEIDKILDKIKISGYETLSAEEKRKLFEQSKN